MTPIDGAGKADFGFRARSGEAERRNTLHLPADLNAAQAANALSAVKTHGGCGHIELANRLIPPGKSQTVRAGPKCGILQSALAVALA